MDKSLEKVLSAKGKERWDLLENLALEHGYELIGENSYKCNKDYLIKKGRRIVYLENITNQAYKEIKNIFEKKEKINPSMIGNALTLGSSTLGGGVVGYLLIQAGLNPLVMVFSVITPPCVCLYEIFKHSMKENKQFIEINKVLDGYKKNIFYDDVAIKKFCSKTTKKVSIKA